MAKRATYPGRSEEPEDKEDRKLLDAFRTSRLPVNELHPIEAYVNVAGNIVESRKLNEIAELIWLPETLSKDEKNARIVRAIELFEELKPQDAAETMLAAQMVGTHTAALECLRRAALPNQTFEGRTQNLKLAQKLMALYAQQLATLNKHRGKGQQKMTIEHVNVEPGGQAIVGNVEAGLAGTAKLGTPSAIERKSEMPGKGSRNNAKAPSKRSK